MLDATKEIIIALINNGYFKDFEAAKSAIKEIYQEIQNAK